VILDVKCETHYPSVQAIKSGAALKAVPKLSKHLVVHMEGLLAVRPFRFSCQGCRGGCRSRCALNPEPARQRALHGLPLSASSGNVTARPQDPPSAVDADEPAPAAGDQEEATEVDAPSGGGDSSGFVLDYNSV
jgi:hypothetical protein